jgi:tRNA U34 5-carboxymethylaminomethyl modifying GTPase MnmE/TrmE
MPLHASDLIIDIDDLLRNLNARSARFPALGDCIDRLVRLKTIVSKRPRVVLLGEGNSGKTALANLLLADEVLPESVVSNTRRPTVIRHSASVKVTGISSSGAHPLINTGFGLSTEMGLHAVEVELPNLRLQHFDLVDTPAFSDPDQLKAWNVRPSDLLIWCTLASQAWKESERRLWQCVSRRHQQNAILVATHKDTLHGDATIESVRSRLIAATRDCARSVVLVSSVIDDTHSAQADREASGIEELEARIAEGLATIVRRRLTAATRVANSVATKAIAILET